MSEQDQILIYDGNCRFCRESVKFLSGSETAGKFQFLPAKNDTTASLLKQHNISPELTEKTVILIQNNHIYTRSTAIIKALRNKGGFWRLSLVLFVIPAFIRNWIYDLISRRRKKDE